MQSFLRRLRRSITGAPGRLVRAVPWAHLEIPGLGAGSVASGDLAEQEARRRRDREIWRRGDDGAPEEPGG